MSRILSAVVCTVVLVLVGTACGGGDGSATSTTAAAPAADGDLGRVVALGEEFLLADLLALGIVPVASTATVAEVGFQGLDDFDTDGIEVLANTEQSIEHLAGLRPDTVIAEQWVVDEVGEETLARLGDLITVPAGSGPLTLEELADAVGRAPQAAALLDDLEAARTAAAGRASDDCEVSLGTIYVGPAPAAWIGAPNNVATALEEMGCTLVPSADDHRPDQAGRVYLSMEQLDLLSAPLLILQQTPTVAGEDAALADIEADPLWQQLPAVRADDVVVIDRLGYPGVAGLIRLYDELAGIVG